MRRPLRITGFLLWRCGLLLAGGWTAFEGARFLLRAFDLPAQMELGAGLMLSGAGFFLVSMLLERLEDHRAERGLGE